MASGFRNWLGQFSKSKEERQRERQRLQVERQYQQEHPQQIQIVPLEYQSAQERKLTHDGKFEYASDGKLTSKGKGDRLANRLKKIITVLVFGIIITYVVLIIFP